jgi:DNA polymerase-3 subunit epsilon
MTAWTDGAMVGFDTETTGVDVGVDRVVTAALVRRDSHGTAVRSWLLDPGVEIPEGASAIHGITTERARAFGRPPAEALEQIATALAAAALRGEPVVAYNACFDLSLLDVELRRHGLPTLPDRLGCTPLAVIDPLVLDRHLDRYRRGKRRLGDLCAHYHVTPDGLHTADVDVVATLDVLRAIARAHPQIAAMTAAELHALQVGAHRAWATSFNEWRAGQGYEGPGADAAWPVREPALV